MTYYALKRKSDFIFICVGRSPADHEVQVKMAYNNWVGMQSRNATASFENFMKLYNRVIVRVEELE